MMKSKVPETLSQFMEESSGGEELEEKEELGSACGHGPASLSSHPRWAWEPGGATKTLAHSAMQDVVNRNTGRSIATPQGEHREHLMRKVDDLMRGAATLTKRRVPETLWEFMREGSGAEKLEAETLIGILDKRRRAAQLCMRKMQSLLRHNTSEVSRLEERNALMEERNALMQAELEDANGEIRRLQRSLQAAEEQGECLICMQEAASHAVVPCGHLVCCEVCTGASNTSTHAQQMASLCPVCRGPVEKWMRIYR